MKEKFDDGARTIQMLKTAILDYDRLEDPTPEQTREVIRALSALILSVFEGLTQFQTPRITP
jgi:hypothetical protein